MDVNTIIENIVIKYRFNFNESQDPQKMFKVAMGSAAKDLLVKDIKTGQDLIKQITSDVNSWDMDKIKEEFNKRGLEEKKEKREKHLVFPKMTVEPIDGKVITCYPPEPSKYPHIGHAYACLINYLFAKAHNGKFYIRFEDTNPDLAKEEFYKAQMWGYKWLGVEPDLIVNASDYMEIYYEKLEYLIKEGKAYVCTVKSEDISAARRAKEELPERNNSVAQNLDSWKKMLSGKIDNAVVLAKIDMTSPNAELRDPAIMRINKNPHPKTGTKYTVWPTYRFQSVILDGEMKITHRFRSKEFESLKPSQKILSEWLGYKYPDIFEFARINLVGATASGRKLREMVEQGNLSWDNPALSTLIALKRRGFTKESIYEFVDKAGVSKSESTIEWSVIESFNRSILSKDDIKKIPAFENPVKVNIADSNKILENNPLTGYIDSSAKEIEYRVRHLANAIRNKDVLNITSLEPKKGLTILAFSKDIIEVNVLMPELDVIKKIYVDKDGFESLKEGDVCILEGFAFARLEDKLNKRFVYTHK